MTRQRITQHGTFHVTTNSKHKVPWCTWTGIPEILIDNVVMTKNLQKAELYAFCVLPNHMHIIMRPGPKGLSAFMHSFKRNSAKDIRYFLDCPGDSSGNRTRAAVNDMNGHYPRSRGSGIPVINVPSRSRGSGIPTNVQSRSRGSGIPVINVQSRSRGSGIPVINVQSRSRGSDTPANVRARSSDTPAVVDEFSGWHNGFHDQLIRNGTQCANAVSYVEYNAFRHGLMEEPTAWSWSSLQFEHLLDAMEIWLD